MLQLPSSIQLHSGALWRGETRCVCSSDEDAWCADQPCVCVDGGLLRHTNFLLLLLHLCCQLALLDCMLCASGAESNVKRLLYDWMCIYVL